MFYNVLKLLIIVLECNDSKICSKCTEEKELINGECLDSKLDCAPFAYDYALKKCVA